MRTALAILALSSSAALAAEAQLSGDEITAALSDKSLYGESRGQQVEQIFQKSGQTFYLTGGNSSSGSWAVREGKYCSVWPPSDHWACYAVMRDGDAVTFVAGDGTRYPMRLTK
jgi:hypothetical protein